MSATLRQMCAPTVLLIALNSAASGQELSSTAYVTMERPGGEAVPFVVFRLERGRGGIVISPDGSEAGRSGETRKGVLLPPGEYALRTENRSINIEIHPLSDLPSDADFLAPLQLPSALEHVSVFPINGNLNAGGTDGRFHRVYNSRSDYSGRFGNGWDADFGAFVERLADGGFRIREECGWGWSRYENLDVASGEGAHVSGTLTERGGVLRRLIDPESYFQAHSRYVTAEVFNNDGRLQEVEYGTKERLQITYGNDKTTVTDADTGSVLFTLHLDATDHVRRLAEADKGSPSP